MRGEKLAELNGDKNIEFDEEKKVVVGGTWNRKLIAYR